MQPELFLLAPRNAGTRQTERRRTLLKRRADLLELVGVEADLPEELQLHNIRRMPMPDHDISGSGVWALPLCHALQPTVEDIHEACLIFCLCLHGIVSQHLYGAQNGHALPDHDISVSPPAQPCTACCHEPSLPARLAKHTTALYFLQSWPWRSFEWCVCDVCTRLDGIQER